MTDHDQSAPVVTDQPDLLAARRAVWESRAIEARKPTPSSVTIGDAELADLQAETTERALRNWDQDELEQVSEAQSGGSLSNALLVALTDAADDFTQQRITPIIPGEYREYLRSEHWRALRQRMLLRAGGICQRCARSSRHYGFLDVHHLDYRRLGAEREADLVVLCRECHAAEHGVAT